MTEAKNRTKTSTATAAETADSNKHRTLNSNTSSNIHININRRVRYEVSLQQPTCCAACTRTWQKSVAIQTRQRAMKHLEANQTAVARRNLLRCASDRISLDLV
eukprot:TRINITY_DN6254_c0_g1_i5.p1 TRINITY_DN6254_c0_g1~~TRINITY_DN6254_c0_g1_i5.p1  ORF type:complete len:104 (-),score=18.30 TRINITY_DN6254_c0_g1_i5:80-391(-)